MKKPSLEEIEHYCQTRRNGIDAQAFLDHYDMVGWVCGKKRAPMKDWQAAIRTWERNRKPQQASIMDKLTDRSWA